MSTFFNNFVKCATLTWLQLSWEILLFLKSFAANFVLNSIFCVQKCILECCTAKHHKGEECFAKSNSECNSKVQTNSNSVKHYVLWALQFAFSLGFAGDSSRSIVAATESMLPWCSKFSETPCGATFFWVLPGLSFALCHYKNLYSSRYTPKSDPNHLTQNWSIFTTTFLVYF